MKAFNFNKNAIMGSVLFSPYSINTTTGVITINNLVPANDLSIPEGATHFSISGAVEMIDFSNGTYNQMLTNVVNSSIGSTIVPVALTPTSMPTGTGFTFFMLKVEFFQMVNNVQYSLRNGKHNSLSVIEVL